MKFLIIIDILFLTATVFQMLRTFYRRITWKEETCTCTGYKDIQETDGTEGDFFCFGSIFEYISPAGEAVKLYTQDTNKYDVGTTMNFLVDNENCPTLFATSQRLFFAYLRQTAFFGALLFLLVAFT